MSKPATARLENWYVTPCFGGKNILIGEIYDDHHGEFLDGLEVRTSAISSIEHDADPIELFEGGEVSTKNSVYLLGKPKKVEKSVDG